LTYRKGRVKEGANTMERNRAEENVKKKNLGKRGKNWHEQFFGRPLMSLTIVRDQAKKSRKKENKSLQD